MSRCFISQRQNTVIPKYHLVILSNTLEIFTRRAQLKSTHKNKPTTNWRDLVFILLLWKNPNSEIIRNSAPVTALRELSHDTVTLLLSLLCVCLELIALFSGLTTVCNRIYTVWWTLFHLCLVVMKHLMSHKWKSLDSKDFSQDEMSADFSLFWFGPKKNVCSSPCFSFSTLFVPHLQQLPKL